MEERPAAPAAPDEDDARDPFAAVDALAAHPVPWDEPTSRALRFFLPVALLLVGILIAFLLTDSPRELWAFLVVYHVPLGAYTAPPAAIVLGFSLVFLIAFMTYLRVVGALFYVWNVHWLRGVPRLGPVLTRLEIRGHAAWRRRPGLRRAGLVGLALFVTLPFPGSGLLTGALVGRLSGLNWFPTWIALSIGVTVQLVVIAVAFSLGWTFGPWG